MADEDLLYDIDGKLIESPNIMEIDEDELLGEKTSVDDNSVHPVEKDAEKELQEGARHGVQVREPRLTRSRAKEIEMSETPRDALKRVKRRLEALRENLKRREENKGSTADAIAEFEGLFDEEREPIERDLLLLDTALVVESTGDSELKKFKLLCEENHHKLISLNDEIERAKKGAVLVDTENSAVFESLAELRSSYDALWEEKRNREERDATILASVGVESMEEVIVRATSAEKVDFAARTSAKVLKLVTSLLDEAGHDDLSKMVDELKGLREVNDKQADILEDIMESLKIEDMNNIIMSIQLSKQQLENRIKNLEQELARAHDLIEKRTKERNEAISDHEKDRQRIFEKEKSKSSPLLIPPAMNPEGSELDDIRTQLQRLMPLLSANANHAPPYRQRFAASTSMKPEGSEKTETRTLSGTNNQSLIENGDGVRAPVFSFNAADLPALEKFDGKLGHWKTFNDGFLLRYEKLGDVAAQIVLKEMLSGRALTEYASIPDEYRSKSVRECLEWLKDRCFGNSMFVEMELEKRWRSMTVGSRRVDTVCQDIEYIASRMHTDVQKQEDAMRVQFLLVYENSKEYPELFKMSTEKKSYAEMKEHMRRAEYIERSLNQGRSERHGASNSGRVNSGRRNQLGSGDTNGRVDKRMCYNCQGTGHLGRDCPSKRDNSGRFANMKCIGCGGMGHTIKVCNSDPAVKKMWNKGPEMHNGTLRDAQVLPQNGGSQSNNANFTPIMQSSTGVGQGLGGSGRWNNGGQRANGNGSGFNSGNNSNPTVRMLAIEEAKGGVENKGFNRQKPANVRSGNETQKESVVDMSRITTESEADNTSLSVQASTTGCVIKEDPLFIKRFRPVQGVIGGMQVEACLDTGAEVNLIDKRRVDLMKGVDIERKVNFDICEALGKSVKTIGTVVVDVEMNVGRKCRVGFVVTESDIPTILLGNSALEAMGLELNMKKEVLDPGDVRVAAQKDNAVVLKDVRVEPGRIGLIFVGGGRPGEGSKVLITDRVEVVEGINDGSESVQVPVWNDTDSDMLFKRNDSIGEWCKVEDIVDEKNGEYSNSQAIILSVFLRQ